MLTGRCHRRHCKRCHTSAHNKPIKCCGKLTCGQLISACSTRPSGLGMLNRIRHNFHEENAFFLLLFVERSFHFLMHMLRRRCRMAQTTTALELKRQFFSLVAPSISAFYISIPYVFISLHFDSNRNGFSICFVCGAPIRRRTEMAFFTL